MPNVLNEFFYRGHPARKVVVILSCKIPGMYYEKDIGKVGVIVHTTKTAYHLQSILDEEQFTNYWVYKKDVATANYVDLLNNKYKSIGEP